MLSCVLEHKQLEKCEEILKENGCRMTLPRKVILKLFTSTRGHLNAKEVYLKINKDYPEIGMTTVYRTLDLLVRLKVLNRFEFGGGQSSYELKADSMNHHHHLICSTCGKVIHYVDFIDEAMRFFDKLQKHLSKKYGFRIDDHEVQFYGLCDSCRT